MDEQKITLSQAIEEVFNVNSDGVVETMEGIVNNYIL